MKEFQLSVVPAHPYSQGPTDELRAADTPWLVGSGSLAFLIGAMVSDTADSLLALALVGAGGIAGESWQRLQPKAGS